MWQQCSSAACAGLDGSLDGWDGGLNFPLVVLISIGTRIEDLIEVKQGVSVPSRLGHPQPPPSLGLPTWAGDPL